jgi:predicted nucleotidyltransferase
MNVEQIKTTINGVRGELEARYPVRLIGIFGSVTRDETRPDSDIDILVEPGPGLSLFKLGAVQLALEQALGRPVDLVFESALKPRVRSRVLAELQCL